MKKILKKEVIIAFIIGIILASSVAVYAAVSASQVTYTTEKSEKINNVAEALNDLYNRGNATLTRKVIKTFRYSGHYNATDWESNNEATIGFGKKIIDVKTTLPNYDKLSKDNFCLDLKTIMQWGADRGDIGGDGVVASIESYENGIITINIPRFVRGGNTPDLEISLIAFYIEYK